MELRVLGSTEPAVRLLERWSNVSDIVADDQGEATDTPEDGPHRVLFRTADENAGVRDILRGLVESGVPVISFAQQHDNLEEIFMQLTAERDE
jgi:hypothetical protein